MSLDFNSLGALAAVAGVLVSVGAIIVEARRSRSAHQVSLILEFYNRFRSEQMEERRHAAAEFLVDHHSLAPDDPRWGQVSDIMDFFQVVGTFAKSGNVDTELLHNFFYFWLSHYWDGCKSHVKFTQSRFPMTWSSVEWLYRRLRAFDLRYNAGSLSDLGSEQLDAFFRWECENLSTSR